MLDVIEARRAAAAAACSGIDVFIAPSEFLRAVFREAGVTGGRWEVVGHGVDGCPGGAPAPKAWGARPLRIGFAGLIAPPKGVDLLIRAAESLPEGSYEIDVHGRGDVRPEYAGSLVRQARGRPIRFHGAYEPGASARFMPGWDVAVAPSRWVENAPLAILEAQACGLPVVAADIGGMRELVTDGVNGRLFRAGSSESLAAVLRELIADRGLVERLRRGVRPPPTLEAHAARIEELYAEAVAGGIG
jgi:glycosyltransferase involved in cell wall biosynthesis